MKTINGFIEDDAIMMSAALAFYTLLSLAPLVIILITVSGYFLGDIRDPLLDQVFVLAGPRARSVVEMVIENAGERPITGSVSAVLSGLIALYSSTAVFAHVRKSMNRIWSVESKARWNPLEVFRSRALSLRMVAFVGVALIISFLVGTGMELALPEENPLLEFAGNISSFIVFVLLFAVIFKLLSDVVIHWQDVFAGALGTTLLFEIGKMGISAYLRSSGVGSVYGAAGSLIVFFIWIYYSSIIFFFGVELTHAYTCLYGSGATLGADAEGTPHDLCGDDGKSSSNSS